MISDLGVYRKGVHLWYRTIYFLHWILVLFLTKMICQLIQIKRSKNKTREKKWFYLNPTFDHFRDSRYSNMSSFLFEIYGQFACFFVVFILYLLTSFLFEIYGQFAWPFYINIDNIWDIWDMRSDIWDEIWDVSGVINGHILDFF